VHFKHEFAEQERASVCEVSNSADHGTAGKSFGINGGGGGERIGSTGPVAAPPVAAEPVDDPPVIESSKPTIPVAAEPVAALAPNRLSAASNRPSCAGVGVRNVPTRRIHRYMIYLIAAKKKIKKSSSSHFLDSSFF
jgi:hypothetical protein